MHNESPATVHLKDYAPPSFLVNTVHLDVDIRTEGTLVTATLSCRRNPGVVGDHALVLDGEELETLSVSLDGTRLLAEAYTLTENQLVLKALPEKFTLETQVRI